MSQLQAMRVFTRVVNLCSLHLAAKQLGMSAAAVTRSVGMLEAYLNMRLLNRTTRDLSLTEIGKDYLDGCREIIGKLDEMESNLMRATRDPSGTLRIAAPMTFVTSGLGALLASYRTLPPRIDFDVTTFDTHIDMVEGGYDVCFSDDRRLASATLVSRRLASIDEMVVASPVYLPRHGTPRQISILYSGRNNLSRKVRSFINFTVSQYRAGQDRAVACGCLTKRIRNMAKVLTIEDDELIARDVVRTLTESGLTVDVAHTGREGLAKVMGGDYDVVTLDRILPDLDGLTIVATMRGVGMETPVLVISAMSEVDQRIQGLRAGADDYLPKPFSSEEMSARVEVLLRRRPRAGKTETMLRQGPLELDLVRRKAKYRERELDLQPTEWRVLEYMMRHAGQILARTMIFEAVWGCRFDPGTNRIDVHVGRLRKKIDIAGERSMIRTIRGSGYLFG